MALGDLDTVDFGGGRTAPAPTRTGADLIRHDSCYPPSRGSARSPASGLRGSGAPKPCVPRLSPVFGPGYAPGACGVRRVRLPGTCRRRGRRSAGARGGRDPARTGRTGPASAPVPRGGAPSRGGCRGQAPRRATGAGRSSNSRATAWVPPGCGPTCGALNLTLAGRVLHGGIPTGDPREPLVAQQTAASAQRAGLMPWGGRGHPPGPAAPG